eukprot:7435243-Pyramimonas_sp.AAC.1
MEEDGRGWKRMEEDGRGWKRRTRAQPVGVTSGSRGLSSSSNCDFFRAFTREGLLARSAPEASEASPEASAGGAFSPAPPRGLSGPNLLWPLAVARKSRCANLTPTP